VPFETHLLRAGVREKLKSGTQLCSTMSDDCNSLFTQAEKDFTETVTSKGTADPISHIGGFRRGVGSKMCGFEPIQLSSRSSSRSTTPLLLRRTRVASQSTATTSSTDVNLWTQQLLVGHYNTQSDFWW
jgi:hypothetical protein